MSSSQVYLKVRRVAAETAAQARHVTVADVHESMGIRGRAALILADGDGVICVPRDDAERVVAAAQAKMRKEDETAEKVRAGAAVWELSGAAAIYARMEVQEIDAAFDDS